jgi:hypothetical protein
LDLTPSSRTATIERIAFSRIRQSRIPLVGAYDFSIPADTPRFAEASLRLNIIGDQLRGQQDHPVCRIRIEADSAVVQAVLGEYARENQ